MRSRLEDILPRAPKHRPPIVCKCKPKKDVPEEDTWHHWVHVGDGWYEDRGLCAKAEYHKSMNYYPWEGWSECPGV